MNEQAVSRIAKMLTNAKNFYFTTTDGKRPYVRPYNAIVEFENKLYFYTNNRTHAFKQIETNPFVEICVILDEGKWLRINGKVEYDYRTEVKTAMLEANPNLRTMYSEDDKIFYVFYLSNMEATIHSVHHEPESVC